MITSDDLEITMNSCLRILNATDALQKFYERKKIIILEDARMQKPGAPVVKGTRHKGRVSGGELDLLEPRYGKDVCDRILFRINDVYYSKVLHATTHIAYILLESNMTFALWEHPVN